jgi:hypothetical protein
MMTGVSGAIVNAAYNAAVRSGRRPPIAIENCCENSIYTTN